MPLNPELRSDPTQDPPEVVADAMELQQVRSALALLTPDQRQVITLRYLEEWEIEDYTCSPAYRKFFREVCMSGVTQANLEEYFGNGLFIGRK